MIHTDVAPDPAAIIADCLKYPDDLVADTCRQVVASEAPQYIRDRAGDLHSQDDVRIEP